MIDTNLENFPVCPAIPVTDLQTSTNFYGKVLGLKPVEEEMLGGMFFKAGNNTGLFLYQRGLSRADHTLAGFAVKNIELVMNDLAKKGIVFEKYDAPGIKTDERGIALMGDTKSAWFKDPDGNILAINEK